MEKYAGDFSGYNPSVIAGSFLYIACVIRGERKTQRDVADATNTTEPSIRRGMKKLMEYPEIEKELLILEEDYQAKKQMPKTPIPLKISKKTPVIRNIITYSLYDTNKMEFLHYAKHCETREEAVNKGFAELTRGLQIEGDVIFRELYLGERGINVIERLK
jgi:hypothetical protein